MTTLQNIKANWYAFPLGIITVVQAMIFAFKTLDVLKREAMQNNDGAKALEYLRQSEAWMPRAFIGMFGMLVQLLGTAFLLRFIFGWG